MRTAYDRSPTAKAMFDNFIAVPGNEIIIGFAKDEFVVPTGNEQPGFVALDLSWLKGNTYKTPTGEDVPDTPLSAIVHELGHALGGYYDKKASPDKGYNIEFVNKIYDELHIPKQGAYEGYKVGNQDSPPPPPPDVPPPEKDLGGAENLTPTKGDAPPESPGEGWGLIFAVNDPANWRFEDAWSAVWVPADAYTAEEITASKGIIPLADALSRGGIVDPTGGPWPSPPAAPPPSKENLNVAEGGPELVPLVTATAPTPADTQALKDFISETQEPGFDTSSLVPPVPDLGESFDELPGIPEVGPLVPPPSPAQDFGGLLGTSPSTAGGDTPPPEDAGFDIDSLVRAPSLGNLTPWAAASSTGGDTPPPEDAGTAGGDTPSPGFVAWTDHIVVNAGTAGGKPEFVLPADEESLTPAEGDTASRPEDLPPEPSDVPPPPPDFEPAGLATAQPFDDMLLA